MAKDIEDNDNMTNNNPDPENLGDDIDDIESSPHEMETRTRIFLDGPFTGGQDEVLVDKTETTSAEDGLVETTTIKLKTASGCGHLLHTASEAGLSCVSCARLHKEPLILCSECAKNPDNICFVCNSVCCWKCRRERRIDGEKRIVCEACVKSTLRLKLIKQIMKWFLIAAAIYYLIML